MKKFRVFSVLLSMVILVNALSFKVSAAERCDEGLISNLEIVDLVNESEISPLAVYFSNASIAVGRCDTGMDISISTGVTKKADRIGVKDIQIKRKYGVFWLKENVKVEDIERTDSYGFTMSFVYTAAVDDATYKIICVHYAQEGDEYRELENDSGEFVFAFYE